MIFKQSVRHSRPDIIVRDKDTKDCHIMDGAIPNDTNIPNKVIEKMTNYSLKVETEGLVRMQEGNAKAIPVVLNSWGYHTNLVSTKIQLFGALRMFRGKSCLSGVLIVSGQVTSCT